MSTSESRKRDKVLPPVRCTQEELDGVKAAADHVGLTVSQLVRNRVLQKPNRAGPKPKKPAPAADVKELAKATGLLGKYGSNVNQIAKAANAGRPVTDAQIYEIAAQVKEIQAVVMRALGLADM
jgi:hypothetical protein